ncbi:MAG TPA: LCP family protein [Ktedonobacteraceae bacterium]|nr:LCP family protein [Ktedonobacteraceae bacterium]
MPKNYSQPNEPGSQSPYYSQWQGGGGNGLSEQGRRPYSFPGPEAQDQYGQPVQPGEQNAWTPRQDNPPVYQSTQPANVFAPGPGARQPKRARKKRGCLIGCLIPLVIFVVLFVFAFATFQKVLAFGRTISTKDPLSTQTNFVGGSERINFLIMGYGGSGHDGAFLTDSLVVISLLPQTHHTTLISVPRDLWVQNPANSGSYSKLNDVYPVAAGDQNKNPVAGGDAVAQKISVITGLKINYWMTINFAGFQDFIDAIGGVDVNVPTAFTAQYPANDDPNINPNWIKVKFTKGPQHMDGKKAIVYSRARYVLDNPAEGSDFARSQRQQIIMKAALTKIKDWHTWPQMYGAMDKLEKTLYSNFSLADLAQFALKMDLESAHRVGLSNDNVLEDTYSDDGQAILLPRGGNWSLIPTYVQQQLYR